jgi:hypothetical protein
MEKEIQNAELEQVANNSPDMIAAETMPEQPAELTTETPETPAEGEMPVNNGGAVEEMKTIIAKYYPEADTSTPEALITAALPFVQKLDAFQTWLNESIENEIDPSSAMGMLADLKAGKTWGAAILANFDPEELAMDEGAAAPVEERKQKKAAFGEKIKQWEANEIESANAFIKAADESGLDDKQKEEVAGLAGAFLKDAADRLISVNNWKVFMNGARHEQVVSALNTEKEMAYEDGIVAGKNMKIEKKRMSPEKGDGLPRLTTSGGTTGKPGKKGMTLPVRNDFRV